MPRILDRTTGRQLGDLDEQEYAQLMSLLGKQPALTAPDVVDRLAGSGASGQLLAVVRQILEGGEDFEVEWESDPD